MSNLEPKVTDIYTPRRSQLSEVVSDTTPEAQLITDSVAEAINEYDGFIDNIAETARLLGGDNLPNPSEVRHGIATIAQYAVWRALINQQNRNEGEHDD